MYWVHSIESDLWEERKNIWGETQISVGKKSQTKLNRDVCGNTYLMKVRCDIYLPH